ncbi:unnamed protein product, partial [Mesorhabditis spiculigera]
MGDGHVHSHDHDHGCCCWSLAVKIALFGFILVVLWQTKLRYHLKMFFYLLSLIFGGLIGGLISIPYGRTPKNHFRMFKVFQIINSVLQLNFEIRHKERLESEEPFILIANHQSCMDVLGMTFAWPQNCVVVLKSSLKYLPGFNLCTYLCNAVYINRFNKEKSKTTVDDTAAAIRDHKRKVWLFPEGTRNPGPTLLPFKKGAFILAHNAKIPVVCCVFSTHKQFYDWENYRFDDSGHVIGDILPPIDSTKFETVEELSEHCRKVMQTRFDELNVEIGVSAGDKKSD